MDDHTVSIPLTAAQWKVVQWALDSFRVDVEEGDTNDPWDFYAEKPGAPGALTHQAGWEALIVHTEQAVREAVGPYQQIGE
jgi:hypothetical protein